MLAGIPIHTAMKLTSDQDKCIHCHLCEKACFLIRFCGFDSLEGAAEQYCIGCGHCVAAVSYTHLDVYKRQIQSTP